MPPTLTAIASAFASPAAASCGSAACLVNTQWQIHGIPTEAGGTLFQLQYDYIKQDQLLSGSHKTSVAPEDADASEQKTVSQTLIASLDYTFDQRWGVTATLPAVKRQHDHLADPFDEPTPESWDYTRVGDARIVGRYRFIAADSYNVGAQFGVVLPTGSHTVTNADGVVAERSLQPGTGATSGVLGLYANYAAHDGAIWFAQVQFQGAMATTDEFRPGNQVLVTAGVTWPITESVVAAGAVERSVEGARLRHQRRTRGKRRSLAILQPRVELHGVAAGPALRVRPAAALPLCQRHAARRQLGGRRRRDVPLLTDGLSAPTSATLTLEIPMKTITHRRGPGLRSLLACAVVRRRASHVSDAWVRGTVPGQKVTGAFMQLTSPSDATLDRRDFAEREVRRDPRDEKGWRRDEDEGVDRLHCRRANRSS